MFIRKSFIFLVEKYDFDSDSPCPDYFTRHLHNSTSIFILN